MTTKYGVFSEVHSGHGEPFSDSVKPDPRDKGLNFRVATCKAGKNNDATFDKFKPLYEGEKYVESLRSKLQQSNASRKQNVTDKPFKMASPMKASVGVGDYYGTIGGKIPYVAGTIDIKKKKGEIPSQPKNIVTATSKKGGFGFNKTTLSERQGAKGVAGEYEYLADPIHMATRKSAEEEAAKGAPFRPANPPKQGGPGTATRSFMGKAKGAVGEFEWQPRPEPEVRSRAAGAAGNETEGEAAGKGAAVTPFRPSAYPKHGSQATFTKYPEYLHDPETWQIEARAAARKAEREALAARSSWRPSHGHKSDAQRSIMRMNLK